MRGYLLSGLLSAAMALGLTEAADAQARVELSGRTYHTATCPGPVAAGMARCFAQIVTNSTGTPTLFAKPAGMRAAAAAAVGAGPTGGYFPADLIDAYKISGSGASGTLVAIVDAYGYSNAESDLAVYRAQFGLPACTTANGCFKKVNQSGVQGSYPANNTGWSQETALDLDMVSAICPSCKILLVEATSATLANLAAATNTAAALGAHVISNSYGGSESGSTSYEAAYNHPGVAVTVSTGDSGYGVQFPASSPHVTAVGGTSLIRASNSRGWSETAWSGAGSGCSSTYAKPAWQTDPLCAKRMVGDVSAIADPNTGVAVYGPASSSSTGWLVFGGTSVAAPLVGGIYGHNGGAVSYGSNPYSNTPALFDVTSGSNGSCGGTYFCTAIVGYDGPTGLGTPNGDSAF